MNEETQELALDLAQEQVFVSKLDAGVRHIKANMKTSHIIGRNTYYKRQICN